MTVLYLSHGSPMRVVENSPANRFLRQLGEQLTQPQAIVVISPHWETQGLCYSNQLNLGTLHDFTGFPAELYQQKYQAKSSQALQNTLNELLTASDFSPQGIARELDHGAWSVLKLMYPKADVPIVALSLPTELNGLETRLEDLYRLGQALAPLKHQNIALITTGSATHNLSELSFNQQQAPASWASEFIDWLQRHVAQGELTKLLDYQNLAPFAQNAHPRDEHLRPLFIALGAAGIGKDKASRAELIHDSWELGNLNNSSWLFS